VVEEIAQ